MSKEKQPKRYKKWVLIAGNVVVIAGLAAFGGFYFQKYRDLKNHPVSSDQVAQAEIDRAVANVGKLYASLPKDEKPTVYTVKDKEQLKSQAFFDKAENNDISLIYATAKLAILYRPSSNQIINVSTVNIQATPTAKIIGAKADRDAVKAILDAAYKDTLKTVDGGDAKATYTAITVVDVKGTNAEAAAKIATSIKGQVGALPTDEESPSDADILIVAAPIPQ